MTEHLIVVRCPRCSRTDWRLVEWTGGREDDIYECTHCNASLTIAAYHMLAKEQHDKETAVDRLNKLNKGWGVLLDSMDGEDSQ